MKQFVDPTYYNDNKSTLVGLIAFCLAIAIGIIIIL